MKLPAPLLLSLLLSVLIQETAAAAPPRLLLVAAARGRVFRDRPVNARIGQRVDIYPVVVMRRGRRRQIFTDAPSLMLGHRRIKNKTIRPLSDLGRLSLTWYRVEPRPHHVETPPPNRGNQAYSNAVLFGSNHGKWLGYDNLEYSESEIKGAGDQLSITRTRPTHPKVNVNEGLGTMRYKARIQLGSAIMNSPGMEAKKRAGISARVMRVTFRSSDEFVGYLRGYFNVPNVFGSAGKGRTHQSELYQGADCADVIIGAAREAGARIPYTSVQGFRRFARAVSPRLHLRKDGIFAVEGRSGKGAPVALRFGEDVKPGDIMLIDYAGFTSSPRRWDHIAVIDQDRGIRGQFDPRDPVMHMGYLYGLTEVPAASEAPAYIQILRFTKRVQRAFTRHQKALARQRTRRKISEGL